MIYVDAAVALAHLLVEDRRPLNGLWDRTLVASRLIEYEVWTALHARALGESHGQAAVGLLGRLALLDSTWPPCEARGRQYRSRRLSFTTNARLRNAE